MPLFVVASYVPYVSVQYRVFCFDTEHCEAGGRSQTSEPTSIDCEMHAVLFDT